MKIEYLDVSVERVSGVANDIKIQLTISKYISKMPFNAYCDLSLAISSNEQIKILVDEILNEINENILKEASTTE